MSTTGISQEELLQRLNGLLAEEMEASIRYLHLSMTVEENDREKLSKMLQENFDETVEHAQMVGEMITQMGGTPSPVIRLDLPPERISASEAIQTALIFEQAALDAYRELLERVEVNGDAALLEFARAQVELESQHVRELQVLLEN
ncbi:MAG TPA: hypothetical protein EYN79_03650 [Planctomycetes bacterium]|nr:hypothetical protein [Planctomycetota bacterium]